MGARLQPPAKTWNTRKQKLHLKAAACRGVHCEQCQTVQGREEEVAEAVVLGAVWCFLTCLQQPSQWLRASTVLSCEDRTSGASSSPAHRIPSQPSSEAFLPGTAGLLAGRRLQMQFCCCVFLLALSGAQMLKMNSEKVT